MYGRGSINSTIVTIPRPAPSPLPPPADLRSTAHSSSNTQMARGSTRSRAIIIMKHSEMLYAIYHNSYAGLRAAVLNYDARLIKMTVIDDNPARQLVASAPDYLLTVNRSDPARHLTGGGGRGGLNDR